MQSSTNLSVEQALQALQQGKMIILVDDESRENEGDLVMAAEHIDAQTMNFMIRMARGLVCMPMTADNFTRLNIPLMAQHNRCPRKTAFGVAIEAASGVSTGISAADRAHTVQVAVNPHSGPQDIVMPGHIFPLRAREGGALVRPGHTEGSVDLMRLAGLQPAAVICEVMNDNGSMARLADLNTFAEQHDIGILKICDLIEYRLRTENLVSEISTSKLPTRYGEFSISCFRNECDGSEHLVLQTQAKVSTQTELDSPTIPLVRVHSECLTGDVFGSLRCDCGCQLDAAMRMITKQGGALLYLSQEGRGIGLSNKIRAYALQDGGLDTVEANQKLGFSADQRHYGLAAQLLRAVGIERLRLLTNNPKKVQGLQQFGIHVEERVALETLPTSDNIHYLRTKQEKLGHLLNL